MANELFNIRANNGELMLGVSVSRQEAEKWLIHYQNKVGALYPNERGYYPDRGYKIVQASRGFMSDSAIAFMKRLVN